MCNKPFQWCCLSQRRYYSESPPYLRSLWTAPLLSLNTIIISTPQRGYQLTSVVRIRNTAACRRFLASVPQASGWLTYVLTVAGKRGVGLRRRRETINSRSKCFSLPWAAARERGVVISKDTVYSPSLPKAGWRTPGAGLARCGVRNHLSEIKEGNRREWCKTTSRFITWPFTEQYRIFNIYKDVLNTFT